MFPNKGNKFPARSSGGSTSDLRYASITGDALRASLGDTHRAIKTLMRWTGANERTAKNWLSGEFGPNGDHLIILLRESDAILEAILTAAGWRSILDTMRVLKTHGKMSQALAILERSQADQHGIVASSHIADSSLERDDPVNGPLNDPVNDPVNQERGARLNERQRWFLQELAGGKIVKAVDLQRCWRISEKTAKRDISALKVRKLIEFVGSDKTGAYRLVTR